MKAVVSQKVAQINAQLLAMPLRSRVLLLAACLFVVYGAVTLALTPRFKADINEIALDIAATEKKLADAEEILKTLAVAKEHESDSAYQARIRELTENSKQAEKRRADVRARLVNPNDMALLVENMLASNSRIELLELKNHDPERVEAARPVGPILAAAPTATAPGASKIIEAVAKVLGKESADAAPKVAPVASGEGIYKHPMTIQVKGRYWDVVRFIKAIEDQPHKVLWGDLKLAADVYPFSIADITLYTLNLDTAWIRL